MDKKVLQLGVTVAGALRLPAGKGEGGLPQSNGWGVHDFLLGAIRHMGMQS